MRSLVASQPPPSSIISGPLTRRVEIGLLVAILGSGLAARLVLSNLPGYEVDIIYFTDWANQLRRVHLDEFYGFASPYCDYLPGYIYILALTAWLKGSVSGPGPFLPQEMEPWIKAGPIVADLALGLAVFHLCRHFGGPRRSLLALAFVVFNPGIVFVGAVWGQVESIAASFYMLSLSAILRGHPIAAAIWVGAGLITKPHYGPFLAPVAVAYLAIEVRRLNALRPNGLIAMASRATRAFLLPIAALIGTIQALLLPFSISLWPLPGVEFVVHEIVLSAGIDSFTSSGAFNLWGTQIAGIRLSDEVDAWLSWNFRTWGYVFLGTCLAPTLVLAWKRPASLTAVLWCSTFAALAFFEVMTRMHERYFFPVVPLLAAGAALRFWIVPWFIAASGLYAVNLWYIWRNYADLHANQRLITFASDFSVLLFLATAVVLFRLLARAGVYRKNRQIEPAIWEHVREGRPGLASNLLKLVTNRFPVSGWLLASLLVSAGALGISFGQSISSVGGHIGVQRLEILGYRSWQDTGITLTVGQRLHVAADGLWMHRSMGMKHFGPAGIEPADSKYLLPSAPKGALIGRIGDSQPFLVSEQLTMTAGASGRLQLVMNDWPTGFDNNRGRVYVTIVVSNP